MDESRHRRNNGGKWRMYRKFSRRFQRLESMAAELDVSIEDATLDVLDAIWEEVKIEEG